MSYQCILCGATSNRKNRPFDSADAVIGHINAKRDDVHEGEDGEDYRGKIDEVEADPPELTNDINPPTVDVDEDVPVTGEKASTQLANEDKSADSDTNDLEIAFENDKSGSKATSIGVVLGTVIAFLATIVAIASTKHQQDDTGEIEIF